MAEQLWKKQIQEGSFRGIDFEVQDHAFGGGRRLAVHEYPQRDTIYAEDMGRKRREIKIKCYVAGDDYTGDRDDLIEALDAPGAGTLVHPWLGQMQCKVDAYHVTESSIKGGMAEFDIAFVESGELEFPTAVANTTEAVSIAADNAQIANHAQFVGDFDTTGQPDFVIASAQDNLTSFVDTLKKIAGLKSPINLTTQIAMLRLLNATARNLMRLPSELALSILELVNGAKSLTALHDFSVHAAPQTLTPARARQQKNNDALVGLIRRAAVIQEVTLSSAKRLPSQSAMQSERSRVAALLDVQIAACARTRQDNAYRALRELKRDYIEDITRKVLTARRSFTHTTMVPTNTLALSYHIYGELRDLEIVDRNHIAHPGFISRNRTLDLLTLDKQGN